jgi:Na+-transporting NADH:ubiquinone oxidoreductase subunit D
MADQPKAFETLTRGIWKDNPIFMQILGICSALAVTGQVFNTAVMGIAVIFVTAFSCLLVSILREYTPNRVRMMTQLLIIAGFVTVVDQVLKAYLYETSKTVGPYVALIITNCIVMGRCEGFAKNNKPGLAFLDGMGAGIGYAVLILLVAFVREPLGSGTLFAGTPWIIHLGIEPVYLWGIMVMPAGAFFVIAAIVWINHGIIGALDKKAAAKGAK